MVIPQHQTLQSDDSLATNRQETYDPVFLHIYVTKRDLVGAKPLSEPMLEYC